MQAHMHVCTEEHVCAYGLGFMLAARLQRGNSSAHRLALRYTQEHQKLKHPQTHLRLGLGFRGWKMIPLSMTIASRVGQLALIMNNPVFGAGPTPQLASTAPGSCIHKGQCC